MKYCFEHFNANSKITLLQMHFFARIDIIMKLLTTFKSEKYLNFVKLLLFKDENDIYFYESK